MAESGVGLLISPLVTQQDVLVRLLEFWEQRIEVDSKYIKGLKALFPLLPDILPADTFEVAIQSLAHALRTEIDQRQDALKKLQAAHKVISVDVIQRHPSGGTRPVFATGIDWLKQREAHLSSEEEALDEDRTMAELASRESRPPSSLTRRGGLLNRFRDIIGPGPPPPQFGGWYTIADLHFRHRVFAINLERDEFKASIEDHASEWVTTLKNCVKAMKNMSTTFADAQVDLAGVLNVLGSRIRYTAPDDIVTQRTTSFTLSVEEAILKRLLPPHRYVNFKYHQLSAMPVIHATHYIIFGCSIPESNPKTGSPQAHAIDAFYYLLRQPYQPDASPTTDVSRIAYLFEQYWSLSHNRERRDAPASGMEWEGATPDLVLVSPLPPDCHPWRVQQLKHFLRCLPTPLLPVPSQFESRNLENQAVGDALMREWGRGMEQETPRTHLLGAIRKYTIPYLGARTEGHITFLRKLAVALTHKSDCYRPVNRLLCHEEIGEMTWQWI